MKPYQNPYGWHEKITPQKDPSPVRSSSSTQKQLIKQQPPKMQSAKDLLPIRSQLMGRSSTQKTSLERKEKFSRQEAEKPYSRPTSSEKIKAEKMMKNNEVTEKLNNDLLDLVNNKVDFFLNNIKVLMNTTNKLIKFVYAKSPEIEQLLKTFKNQKTVVDETIQNLEKSILKVNYQNKIKNIQFSSVLKEDIITDRTDLATDRISPPIEQSNEDTTVEDISNSILIIEEKLNKHGAPLDSYREIQKLKSMVNHLEKKNNIIMKKLETEPPEHRFGNSGQNFFQKLGATSDEERLVTLDKNRNIRAPTSPGNLMNRTQTRSPQPHENYSNLRGDLDSLNNAVNHLRTENLKLLGDNNKLAEEIKGATNHINELKGQLEIAKNDHSRAMAEYRKLRKAYETEKNSLYEAKRMLEGKENELNYYKMTASKKMVEMRKQVERFISEFTHLMDTKYRRMDTLLERKEHEVEGFRDMITGKIRDLEKSITETYDEVTPSADFTSNDITVENKEDERKLLRNFIEGRDDEIPDPKLAQIHNYRSEINEIDKKIQNLEMILVERKDLPQDRKADMHSMIEFLTGEKLEIIKMVKELEAALTSQRLSPKGGTRKTFGFPDSQPSQQAESTRDMMKENKYLKDRTINMQTEIEKWRVDYNVLLEKLQQAEEDMSIIKDKAKANEKLYGEKIEFLNNVIDELKSRNKMMSEQFNSHQGRGRYHERDSFSEERSSTNINFNVSALSPYQKNVDRSAAEIRKLEEANQKNEKNISDLRKQNLLLQESKTDLTKELEKLTQELSRTREMVKIKDNQIISQEHLIQEYEMTHKSQTNSPPQKNDDLYLPNDLYVAKNALDRRNQEFSDLLETLDKMKEEIAKKNNQIKHQEDQLEDAVGSYERLKSQFDKYRQEQENVTKKNKEYFKEVEDNLEVILSKNNKQVKQMESDFQKEREFLKQKIAQLEKFAPEKDVSSPKEAKFDIIGLKTLIQKSMLTLFQDFNSKVQAINDRVNTEIDKIEIIKDLLIAAREELVGKLRYKRDLVIEAKRSSLSKDKLPNRLEDLVNLNKDAAQQFREISNDLAAKTQYLQKLQDQVKRLETENSGLKAEKTILLEEVASVNDKLNAQSKQLNVKLPNKLEELAGMNKETAQQFKEITNQIATKTQNLQKLQEQMKTFENNISRLENENVQLKQENKVEVEKCSNQAKEMNLLMEDFQSLQKDMIAKDNEIKTLKVQLKSLEKSKEETLSQLTTLQTDLDKTKSDSDSNLKQEKQKTEKLTNDFKEKYQKLQSENESLKKSAFDSNSRIKLLETTINDMQNKNQGAINEELLELRERLSMKESQLRDVSDQVDKEKKKHDKTFETIHHNISALCIKIKDKLEDPENFEKKDTLDGVFNKLAKYIEKMSKRIDDQKAEISEKEKTIKEQLEDIKEIDAETDKELEDAQAQVKQAEQRVKELEASLIQQSEGLNKLRKMNDQVEIEYRSQEEYLKIKEAELKNSQDELQAIKEKLINSETSLNENMQELDRLRKKTDQVEIEHRSQGEYVKNKEDELKKLQNDLQAANKKLITAEELIKTKETEGVQNQEHYQSSLTNLKADYEKQLSELRSKIEKELKQASDKESNLAEEKMRNQTDLEKANTEIANLKNTISLITQDKQNLDKQLTNIQGLYQALQEELTKNKEKAHNDLNEAKNNSQDIESKLQAQIDELQKQLKHSGEENQILKNQIEKITATSQREQQQLTEKVSHLETQLQTEKNEADENIKKRESEISTLKKEKEQLQGELSKSNGNISSLDSRINEMNATITELNNEKKSLTETNSAKTQQIQSLEQRINDILKNKEDYNKTLEQEFNQRLSEREAEIDKLNKQLESERQSHQGRIESQNKEFENQKTKLNEEFAAKYKDYETKLGLKEGEIEQLNNQLNEVKSERNSALTELSKKSNDFEKQSDQLKLLSKEVEQKQTIIVELEREVEKKDEESKTLNSTVKNLKEQISDFTNENKSLKDEIEAYKSTIQRKESEISDLKNREEQVRLMNEERCKNLEAKLSEKENQLLNEHVKLGETGQIIKERENKLQELSNIINQKDSELQTLKSNLVESQKKTSDLEKSLKDLENQLEQEKSRGSSQSSQLTDVSRKYDETYAALENARAQISEKDKNIAELEQKRAKLEGDRKELDKEYKAFKARTNDDLNDLQQEIDEKGQKISELAGQVNELSGVVATRETQLKNQNEEIKSLKANIKELSSSKDLKEKDFLEKINELASKNAENTNKSNQLIEKLTQDLQAKEKVCSETEKQLNQALKDKESLEQSLSKVNGELNSANNIIENQRNEIESQKNKISEIQNDVAMANEKIKELQTSLETKEGQINTLQTSENSSLEEKGSLAKEITRLKDETEKLKFEKDKIISELSEKINNIETNEKSLQNEIQKKGREIDGLKSEMIRERDQRGTEKQQLSEKISILEKEKQKLQEEKQKASEESQNAKLDIEKLSKEKTNLTQKMESMETRFNETEASLRQLKKEAETETESLKARCKELTEKHQESIKENERVQGQLNGEQSKRQEVEGQISQLNEKLSQVDAFLSSKDKELEETKRQVAKLESQIRENQESMKLMSSSMTEKDERVQNLCEELDKVRNANIEQEKEIIRLKGDISKMDVERNHFIEEKISLKQQIELLQDTKSNESQKLIQKYEEIINLNKRHTEEKERVINGLNQEIGKYKEMLASKERDFQLKNEETNQQVAHLKGVNEVLQRQYEEIKKDTNTKLESSSAELARLRPLQEIAQLLFEDYAKVSTENSSAALGKLRERIRDLTTKEDDLTIVSKERNEIKSRLEECNNVINSQKGQLEKFKSVIEERLKLLSPGNVQELSDLLFTAGKDPSDQSLQRLQAEIEKNLAVDKRLQYRGLIWCIIVNNGTDRLKNKYYIKPEEEIEASPISKDVEQVKVINLDVCEDLVAKIEESEAKEEQLNQAIRDYENEIAQLKEKLQALEAKPIEQKIENKRPPRFIGEELSKSISAINLDKEDESEEKENVSKIDEIFVANPVEELEEQITQREEAIKTLENKIEEMASANKQIVEENESLRKQFEDSDRFHLENTQLRIANDTYKIEFDKMVDELKDRDKDEEKYMMQITLLKKELEEAYSKMKQSQSAHEKQHLKTILMKFMDKVLKSPIENDAPEMANILCSLVGCSDKEKKELLEKLSKLMSKSQGKGFKFFQNS